MLAFPGRLACLDSRASRETEAIPEPPDPQVNPAFLVFRGKRATLACPACLASSAIKAARENRLEKAPPDHRELRACPAFQEKKANRATLEYPDHQAHQAFLESRVKLVSLVFPACLVLTDHQDPPESPDETARPASQDKQAKRVTKEDPASLELRVSGALTDCPACLETRVTPAFPEVRALTAPLVLLEPKANPVFPDCPGRRVYLAMFPRKEIEVTQVCPDHLALWALPDPPATMESWVLRENRELLVKAYPVSRASQERKERTVTQEYLEHLERKAPTERPASLASKETGDSPASPAPLVSPVVTARQVSRDQKVWTVHQVLPAVRVTAVRTAFRDLRAPSDPQAPTARLASQAWMERQASRETEAILAFQVKRERRVSKETKVYLDSLEFLAKKAIADTMEVLVYQVTRETEDRPDSLVSLVLMGSEVSQVLLGLRVFLVFPVKAELVPRVTREMLVDRVLMVSLAFLVSKVTPGSLAYRVREDHPENLLPMVSRDRRAIVDTPAHQAYPERMATQDPRVSTAFQV